MTPESRSLANEPAGTPEHVPLAATEQVRLEWRDPAGHPDGVFDAGLNDLEAFDGALGAAGQVDDQAGTSDAGFGTVAGISSPTSLAVDTPNRLNMTLIGFLRDGRFNLYCGCIGTDSP
jgi:hypothetical protein